MTQTKSVIKTVVTVLAGLGALAAVLWRFGGLGMSAREFMVETYSDDPVPGLAVGATVNFLGVKVGTVKDIGFTVVEYYGDTGPEDDLRVRIVMALDVDKIAASGDDEEMAAMLRRYVDRGMRATVTSGGITGISRVELTIPVVPAPVAALRWQSQYPLVPPQPSLMNSFSKSATLLMDRLNQMDLMALWTNLQSAAESSAAMLAKVDEFVGEQRPTLSATLTSLETVAADLSELVSRLKENPSLILRGNSAAPLPETLR